ncbi:hypothetical protein ACOCEA_00480 [Maribacter sp. CXY002]|uniref:hypothetical protein n=1 Tax=Maribacter luteocoastalis TaxID=3407671 RepID=UPI003B676EFF
MTFNWIITPDTNEEQKERYLHLEYQLRHKITKYLLERLENECEGDFSSFYFDVDMLTKKKSISEQTPLKYRKILLPDFDQEISKKCC